MIKMLSGKEGFVNTLKRLAVSQIELIVFIYPFDRETAPHPKQLCTAQLSCNWQVPYLFEERRSALAVYRPLSARSSNLIILSSVCDVATPKLQVTLQF